MRYLTLYILTTVIVLIFAGCSPEPPVERFESCFNAVLGNDLAAVHGYSVFMDRATIAVDEFVSTYSFNPDEYRFVSQFRDRIIFELDSVFHNADTLYMCLSVQAPGFMENILNLIFFTIDTIIDIDVDDDMASAVDRLRSYQGMLKMVKEDHAWYIYGNWEAQRRIETEQAQDRLEYMAGSLGISSIKMYHEDGRPRLSALLKNRGNRALSDVEVYIIGYTRAHEPCFTATAHPLGSEPLRPNSARRFSIDISQAPANWSGKVEARILNCTFEKEP